jgi:hypothetical protein
MVRAVVTSWAQFAIVTRVPSKSRINRDVALTGDRQAWQVQGV